MKKTLFLSFCMLLFLSCSSSSTQDPGSQSPQGGQDPSNPTNIEWSIPKSEVLDGGPGKDGIPALVNPTFIEVQNATILLDTDLVLGFKNGDDIRAYPHIILDWHEIINDNIGDVSLAVTYCPLTGTGIGWNRIIDGKETTFGVSGLLYNTNLIPFDRATDSNWSQILNESVNGNLLGEKADLIMLVETNWKTWKAMYPNTKVVGISTGFSRTYGISPYGDYNTNNSRFLFPVEKDNRLPLKERVLAIVDDGESKVYRFNDFSSKGIIKDRFKGKDYLVVGSQNFMVSFELDAQSSVLDFEYINDGTELILMDNEGTEWNVFGKAITGSSTGQQLKPASAFMAFWFSIPAFYKTEIYDN